MKARASMAVCCALVLGSISCGGKESAKKAEEVEVKHLKWADNNATLRPQRFIAIDGEVVSNAHSTVTLTLTDASDRPIKQEESTLRVSKQSPPSDKDSFSLKDDMNIKVYAGPETCNGDYALMVQVAAGRSNVVKPLYFKVVDGKDCTPQLDLTSEVKKGSVHNVLGPKEGAFDLIEGQPVRKSQSGATKDIMDVTQHGSATPGGGFRKVLESANGARFIVDNSLNFNEVTPESALALFSRQHGERRTPVLRVGDLVYVKLSSQRDQGSIYLLKITRIDETAEASSEGTNGGVLEFDYRKVSG